MKIYKIILIFTAIFLIASGPAFAQVPDMKELQKAINGFSEEVALALPFNSTIGLNWSHSYIGQFLDLPPHFGVGLSAGLTTFGMETINGVMEIVGADPGLIPDFLRNMGMPLPAYTIEGRLGGFILPFDIGFKFGTLPIKTDDGFFFDYLLVGFDFRYALIDIPVIKFSVGAGYNFLRGGVGFTIDDVVMEIPMEDVTGNSGDKYTFTLDDPTMGFIWGTHTIELKAQVSFNLLIVTPYVGTGVSVSFPHAGYRFTTDLSVTNNFGGPNGFEDGNTLMNALTALGVSGVTANGFESIVSPGAQWNMRLYGGLSFNIAIFKIDLTAMYNLVGQNWGGQIGLRIQI